MEKDEIVKNRIEIKEPSSPGVYFLIGHGNIVYVGSSFTPETRVETHRKNKNFDSYTIIRCSEEEMKELEAQYIFEYTPKYNNIIQSKNNVKQIAKTTKTGNKKVNVTGAVIGNKLYINVANIDFDFIRSKEDRENDNK